MSKPGHYSRERDARRAARDKGLKDEEFELLQGPKGWTWREKKKYIKVEGAKLHVGKEVVPVPVPGHAYIWQDPNGRFRWQDESEGLSNQSFETIEDAEKVLNEYLTALMTPKPEEPKAALRVEFGDAPPEAVQEFKDMLTKAGVDFVSVPAEAIQSQTREEFEDHSINEEILPSKPIEKRICPNCEEMVDTFISGDKLRYVEHSFGDEGDSVCNSSEEEVVNVQLVGAPQSDFKPHELAQIQNGDPIPPGTFSPDSLPKKEKIPRIHRSTVENPSKRVWEIAEQMHKDNPSISRKEVLAECVRQGVAYYTARTQYQVWVTVQKQSAAHADEINKR